MPKHALFWKMDLEGLDYVSIKADTQYALKIKCSNCSEMVNDSWVELDPANQEEVKGGRGTANLVCKCKGCRRENSMDLLPGAGGKYSSDQNSAWAILATFDCRGMEPTEWQPRSGFEARAEDEGTKYGDVDLAEDWCDFDDKKNASVGIYNLEHKIQKVK